MKICVDPGHGGADVGAVFRDYREKDIALDIALELKRQLRAQKHDVVMTRDKDRFVSIGGRTQVANIGRAELFISIHLNADRDPDYRGDPEAEGQEVWIYPGAARSRRIAEAIAQSLKKEFPEEIFRGVKEGDFGVLRMTTMPAVLVEVGFIDNQRTVTKLARADIQARIAGAIASAVQ